MTEFFIQVAMLCSGWKIRVCYHGSAPKSNKRPSHTPVATHLHMCYAERKILLEVSQLLSSLSSFIPAKHLP